MPNFLPGEIKTFRSPLINSQEVSCKLHFSLTASSNFPDVAHAVQKWTYSHHIKDKLTTKSRGIVVLLHSFVSYPEHEHVHFHLVLSIYLRKDELKNINTYHLLFSHLYKMIICTDLPLGNYLLQDNADCFK